MPSEPAAARASKNGVLLAVRVHPRSSRAGITGVRDGALLARLNSPPEKGKANSELIELLAEALGVRKTDIEIASGAASRNKKVLIRNNPLADIEKKLALMASEE
jgi:uncharacterized protein